MQSEALTTLTARYSLREDRIVVDGVIHTGDELQLAFTQRLARALVAGLGTGARVTATSFEARDALPPRARREAQAGRVSWNREVVARRGGHGAQSK